MRIKYDHNLFGSVKKIFVLTIFLFSFVTFAKSNPRHSHEDLFAEEDLQIGFRLGPQITMYTPYKLSPSESIIAVQSKARLFLGAGFRFIYDLPRFEFDLLWNIRPGLNTDDSYHSFSVPVSLKFPVMSEDDVDLELGFGYQPDFVLFGADPHGTFYHGVFPTAGLLIDFVDYLFHFEIRYLIGLNNYAAGFTGGEVRDFQIHSGLSWHF